MVFMHSKDTELFFGKFGYGNEIAGKKYLTFKLT